MDILYFQWLLFQLLVGKATQRSLENFEKSTPLDAQEIHSGSNTENVWAVVDKWNDHSKYNHNHEVIIKTQLQLGATMMQYSGYYKISLGLSKTTHAW